MSDYPTAAEYFADKAHWEKWQRTHGPWAPGMPPKDDKQPKEDDDETDSQVV